MCTFEEGNYYDTDINCLRASFVKVKDDGTSTLKPICSYVGDRCMVLLRCVNVLEDEVIFRELDTDMLIYGHNNLGNVCTNYDTLNENNYDMIRTGLLNEKMIWVSLENVHEANVETYKNNIEVVKSINHLCDTANQIWVEGDWEKKIYKLFKSSVTAIKSREIYTHKRREGLKFNLQYFLHHVVEEVFKNTKTCELLKSFSIADDAIVVGDRIIMAKTESTTKNKVKIVKYIVYDYKSGLNTVLDLDLITENNRTVPVVNSYICGDWIEYLLEYHKSIENKPSEYDHGSKTNKRSGK